MRGFGNDSRNAWYCAAATLALVATDTGAAEKSAGRTRQDRSATLESVIVEGRRGRSAVVLDEPVLTGSRLNIEARDLPASVSVVPRELIELRGARTALESIESAVGMTGGTSVGSIPSYATRGFAGNDITIMRDGIRQNTNSQSSRPLDSFLFERIEVLKGPASLLYGEGAVGGAINYVSKLPGAELDAQGIATYGQWSSFRLAAGVGGPTAVDGLSARFDASHARSDGYVDGSGFEYSAAAFALRYRASERTSLTLQATYLEDYVNSYYGTPVIYDAAIDRDGNRAVRRANAATDRLDNPRIDERTRRLNYNNLDNFAEAENSFTKLILDTGLSESWSLRNELYAATQHFDWRNTESTVWNPATQLVERGSFFLIYRNDLQLGNRVDLSWDGRIAGRPNKLVIGALYDNNEQMRNSGQSYPGSPAPADVPLIGFDRGYGPPVDTQRTLEVVTETLATYVENVYEPADGLKIVAGLRYDSIDVERISYVGAARFTKSYEPVTGRLGLVYEIAPEINVYASYSRAAQPVSQLVSLSPSQADFSLQKGTQYEIGAKASIGSTDVTLAVFDIEKSDMLTSSIVDGVRINSQIGAQVSQGAELAAAFTLPSQLRIDAHVAWTWETEFEDFDEVINDRIYSRAGNAPPNVPQWVAGLFFVQDIAAWQLTLGARHVGERQANNNNGIQLDAYTTLEAGVRYRWGGVDVTLRGRNLTDERYAEWASAGGLVMRLAEPRSAEVSLKYAF